VISLFNTRSDNVGVRFAYPNLGGIFPWLPQAMWKAGLKVVVISNSKML
jgi:hypothetical protein